MDFVQLNYMRDIRKDGEGSILGLTREQVHLGDLTSDMTRSPGDISLLWPTKQVKSRPFFNSPQ
jgi:hypothetical protein